MSIRIPFSSEGISLPFVVGDSGAIEITSWAAMRDANDAELAGLTVALSTDVSAWGDSLTAGAGSGGQASDSWVPEMGAYITNTLNNEGVGGETSSQILTRINAATAGQKAQASVVMFGTNDGSGGSYEAPTVIANYDSAATAITGPNVLVGGFQTLPYGVFGGAGAASKDTWRHLRETYPDSAMSLWACMVREIIDDPTAENDLLEGSFLPLQISSFNLHFSDASGLKKDAARALMAADGAGPPMVLEEEVPVRYVSGSAAGAVVHTVRHAGTATSWDIVGGNADGAFSINASGQLLATAVPFADDIREVFVRATNANGFHYGRVIVGLAAADNNYSQATRCPQKTGGIYHFGSAAPREFSIAMLVRYNSNGILWKSDDCNFRSNSGGTYTLFLRDSTSANISLPAINPGAGWHWIMASVRIDATTAANGARAYGYDSTITADTPTTLNPLSMDVFSSILTEDEDFGLAGDHDIGAMWVAREFVDWSSSTVRDALFNASTLDPVATGNGTIAGVAPEIWMYGGPGDWAAGHNRGAADVNMIPTLDTARAQYSSVTS